MPVTYRIAPDERIVYLTTTGKTGFNEWQATMLAVLADPAYRPGFNVLSDRRQESDVPLTAFARSAAEFLRQHSREMGRFRWAAVSTVDAVYGMQRMFSILATGAGIEADAFRDFEEARRWLLSAPAAGK